MAAEDRGAGDERPTRVAAGGPDGDAGLGGDGAREVRGEDAGGLGEQAEVGQRDHGDRWDLSGLVCDVRDIVSSLRPSG